MPATTPHIMVVDDNESVLETIAMVLHCNAFRVSACTKLDDFTAGVLRLNPDLVLLDKSLGWADGAKLCTALKTYEATSHIRVIMLSAFHNEREHCLASGADAFLEKPFDLNELLRQVRAGTAQLLQPS